MDQKTLRAKLLAVLKTPPVKFAGAPAGLEVYYRKPTVEQQGRWLAGISTGDGKVDTSKMGLAIAAAVQECACTEAGEQLFERGNLAELQAAEADTWVAKLGAELIRHAGGSDSPGKDSGETAAASSSSP